MFTDGDGLEYEFETENVQMPTLVPFSDTFFFWEFLKKA